MKLKNLFTKRRLLILFIVFLLINLIPYFIKGEFKKEILASATEITHEHFAIVLGAGLTKEGNPSNYLGARLDDAVLLYNANKCDKILLSGDNSRVTYDEISAMNNYLVAKGIPQNVIFGDYAGFDTYSTMVRAKKLFSIDRAIIISQSFHLPRCLYLAKKKGIEAQGFSSGKEVERKINYLREHPALIKAFFNCLLNRKPKFLGDKIDTSKGSNILVEQL